MCASVTSKKQANFVVSAERSEFNSTQKCVMNASGMYAARVAEVGPLKSAKTIGAPVKTIAARLTPALVNSEH